MRTAFLIFICLFYYSILPAQDEIKNYKPPKVMKGSELQINTESRFSNFKDDNYTGFDKDFRSELGFGYTRWRYSGKLNYIVNFGTTGSYSFYKHSHQIDYFQMDTYNSNGSSVYTDTRTSLSVRIEGGVNNYFVRKLFYAGLNGASNLVFSSSSKPASFSY